MRTMVLLLALLSGNQAQLQANSNALAESWVDSLKTELIADRVWRSRPLLELAIVDTSIGSTTPACTNRWATSRPPNTNRRTQNSLARP